MRLKRVRGDTSIVAPDFVQEHIAGNDAFGGAVEELENICLFLRQAHFFLIFREQHLLRGLKRIWPKLENGVF